MSGPERGDPERTPEVRCYDLAAVGDPLRRGLARVLGTGPVDYRIETCAGAHVADVHVTGRVHELAGLRIEDAPWDTGGPAAGRIRLAVVVARDEGTDRFRVTDPAGVAIGEASYAARARGDTTTARWDLRDPTGRAMVALEAGPAGGAIGQLVRAVERQPVAEYRALADGRVLASVSAFAGQRPRIEIGPAALAIADERLWLATSILAILADPRLGG